MGQCPPAVFAALDPSDMPAVEADQQDRAGRRLAARAELDPRDAAIDGERHRYRVAVAPRQVERMLDILAVRADRLPPAVDDDLRRVDGRETEKPGVAVLPPGRRGAGVRVLPAEPVPVIDVERQG